MNTAARLRDALGPLREENPVASLRALAEVAGQVLATYPVGETGPLSDNFLHWTLDAAEAGREKAETGSA